MNTSSLFLGGVFFAADGKRFSCFQQSYEKPSPGKLDKLDNKPVISRLIRSRQEKKWYPRQFVRAGLIALACENALEEIDHLLDGHRHAAPANRIKDHHTGKT